MYSGDSYEKRSPARLSDDVVKVGGNKYMPFFSQLSSNRESLFCRVATCNQKRNTFIKSSYLFEAGAEVLEYRGPPSLKLMTHIGAIIGDVTIEILHNQGRI